MSKHGSDSSPVIESAPDAPTVKPSLPAGLAIRKIEPADDAALAQIVRARLAAHGLDIPGTAYFDPELDHLSAFYAEKPAERTYLVLHDDRDGGSRVAGGAGIAEFPGIDSCCELQKLYLIEGMQGSGLGRILIEEVEARAREMGYRHIYLETHHSLKRACGFYAHLGYRRVAQPVPTAHTTMDRFFLKEL